MEFSRKTFDAQPYLYVARECAFDGPEIAKAMASGFADVFGFVAQHNITPLSMPMTAYLGMDPKLLRFRSGVMVSAEDASKAAAPVNSATLPAGDAMHATHKGAYTTLNQTHKAMWAHMEAHNITATMPIWEIYADDPEKVAEANLKTEIYCAIT